jgi:hypothetical protein
MHRKTPIVRIERQLWPQPPDDVYPYWCYINTLMFKDKETHKTVWQQDIPEGEFDSKWQCRVKYEDGFGWILIAIATHEKAKDMIMKMTGLNLTIEQ